jgi:hypothetical protein
MPIGTLRKLRLSWRRVSALVLGLGVSALCVHAADNDQHQKWEVHDPKRPKPQVVTPGTFSTEQEPGKAPSDAIVLFDGKDLSKWRGDKGEAQWKVENGYFQVVAKTGSITTKEQFGDIQLHVEWMAPNPPKGNSQGRGNSGIFLMGMYECQVLDTYQNDTYADGGAGSVYGQYPPLANANRPPGQWQVYDIVFRKPRYENGEVKEPARITAFLNGVLVQDSTPAIGPTTHKKLAKYPSKHPEQGPISLQDHGDPVRFRNIWVRKLNEQRPVPAAVPAPEPPAQPQKSAASN